MHRLRPLPALLGAALIGACSGPLPFSVPTPVAAPAPLPAGQRDARYEACRAEATRVVQYRDRGQLMRTDETESSRGVLGVTPYSRLEADRGAAQIDRDRLVADCLRGSPATTAPAASAGASGAASAASTAAPSRGRALPPPGVRTR